MGRKLFVGNLNFKTTGDDLKELFSQVGTCDSATVMFDRATGRSRGFGFVEMSTDEEAQKAITEMNGRDLQGRNLNVNEARERTPGGGGGGPRGGGYGGGYQGGAGGSGYQGGYQGGGGGYQGGGGFGGGGFQGGGFGGGGFGGGDFGGDRSPFGGPGGPKRRKEGGSRRGLRAKKRSL